MLTSGKARMRSGQLAEPKPRLMYIKASSKRYGPAKNCAPRRPARRLVN